MSNNLPIISSEFISDKFCSILKKQRESKHYTQEYMAQALGVTIKTYRSWEKGSLPKTTELYNLANILECDVDFLLGRMSDEGHIKKFLSNNFPLSNECFQRLVTLGYLKRESEDMDKKKSAYEFSWVLEYLINTKPGNTLIREIFEYACYQHAGKPIYFTYPALLYFKEHEYIHENVVYESMDLEILNDIGRQIRKMGMTYNKSYLQSKEQFDDLFISKQLSPYEKANQLFRGKVSDIIPPIEPLSDESSI